MTDHAFLAKARHLSVVLAGLALLGERLHLDRGSIEGLPASSATASGATAVGAHGTTASDDEPTGPATLRGLLRQARRHRGPSRARPVSTPKGGTSQKVPDYSKMNPSELQKTIGSQTKQIDSYRAKVNNPRANHPNWNALSREQQGTLLRQWNDEIRRHEASRATAQRMLSQKAR